MPVTFHSSPQSSQEKHAAADTDSEARDAKMSKRGQKSRGIDQFHCPQVPKVVDEASIMIRPKTLFDNPFTQDVYEMAATAWIKACCKDA